MTVKFTSPIPTTPKEFVEPTPDSYFIHWLFCHRCIICKQSAEDVHEIIPRSRSKKSILDWKNRVTLCRRCHDDYHRGGVNDKKIESMQEARKQFLLTFNRKDYVGTFDKVEYA